MTKLINIFKNSLLLGLLFCFGQQLQAAVTYATPLEGKEQVIGNLLEWSTAVESNSEMFIVERSIDGTEYENIGVIDAAGKSLDEKGYRFLDINATNEKAFYRLRQVDMDGTGSISQIVMIRRDIPNQFVVVNMTNTSTASTFRCNLDAVKDGILEYNLRTLENDLIQSGEMPLTFGLNELAIELSNEAVGIYVLQLKMDNELESLVIRKTEEDEQVRNNVASKNKNK